MHWQEIAMAKKSQLAINVNHVFEECLDLSWFVETGHFTAKEFVVEMVLDHSTGQQEGPLRPPKDAMVKQVSMGKEFKGCIQNMPEGRRFLVSVVAHTRGGESVRSPWVRASTLHPDGRDKDLENLDPMSVPRMNCQHCPCPRYVPMRFAVNTPSKMRCRRCGDHYTDHVALEVGEILKARESRFLRQQRRETLTPLPSEALEWDNRECALWFLSDGAFHPRTAVGAYRDPLPQGTGPGGPEGPGGRKGRVSVVTPTTESRQKFHELLWRCFLAQTWPDKELVVVETYQHQHSSLLDKIAQEDKRLVYIKIKRPPGSDWSIGLKRNVGAHLASGEVIANFDDDDLYAPAYLETMVKRLQENRAHAIKLSSWFIFTTASGSWDYCDPVAWGLTKGLDEESIHVKKWVLGYGFSYVFLRASGLEVWYDDISFGEDYTFLTQLQNRKGDSSVTLLHDDFGICLHLQHGANTSNSIPLRKVPKSEACNLDVMELSPHLARLGALSLSLLSGLFADAEPPSRRTRKVLAHTPQGDMSVDCAASATVATFLEGLSKVAGISCEGLLVHRVPLQVDSSDSRAAEASEQQRDKVAADVLGIAFLAELDGAAENLQPDSKSGRQWRKLLESAKRPMHSQDRLGLRTGELWIVPRDPEAEDEQPEEEFEDDVDYEDIKVTCQKSNVKQFFTASHAFVVRLPVGATVVTMRDILGFYLPKTAKVLAEKPGKGLVTLQEAEVVPREVTISEFKGNRRLYMIFSKKQCKAALTMQKKFFSEPDTQKILDGVETASHEYRAVLVKLLSEEVYPPILKRFNVPVEENSPKLFVDAMRDVSADPDLSELWLQVETLMRNQQGVEAAFSAVLKHRSQQEAAKQASASEAKAEEHTG